ncbi:hypothetical protein OHR68_42190 [Spirillospora sp. NBC_00431]
MRLGDDERVAQRHVGRVPATQLKPAVGVEAVGVGVVQRGGGVGVVFTQCLDQEMVVHATEAKGFERSLLANSRDQTSIPNAILALRRQFSRVSQMRSCCGFAQRLAS